MQMSSKDTSHSIEKMIIDLTPLLDVVLLMLIVVLSCNTAKAEEEKKSNLQAVEEMQQESQQLVADANDRADEAEARCDAMRNQFNNYENLNQYVNVISIYVAYQESYRWNRTIYICINNSELKAIPFNDSTEDARWDECKRYIEENIPNRDIPTVISIDNSYISEDKKMLYRDELRLLQLYAELNFEIKYPGYNTEIENE
ncbi:MAG: hypothetical protein K6G43_00325 [Lachnospiraceae bacterium]|nr:hypothetical protein [Lachnospiraceae bacterium]